MHNQDRRHDIDAWRVIAILAVYLHHVGMPFNGDEFHIMNASSNKTLDDLMVLFEQFRLPLLFLISGVGTIYAFKKRTWVQFTLERFKRLWVPLIFGVLVIVPPQTYFEHKNQYSSYFEFYAQLFDHIEVNHLWFIENLFYLSLVCIPLILWLRSKKSKTFREIILQFGTKKYGLLLGILPLLIIKIVSKSYFPEDSKDILNLSSTLFYGYFFVSGIIISTIPQLWNSLKQLRRLHLIIAVFSLSVFYAYYFLPDSLASKYWSLETRWNIWYGLSSLLSWTVLISLLGYGQIWFNKKNNYLRQANEAIYPFYILHQTIIVGLAYYIVQWDVSIGLKMLALLLSSLPLILLIYRLLIYPYKIPRLVMGMKAKETPKHE
jgi:peptidoglycan/LPS O-acetylase OafA/YrhL